ncbi:DUF3667 domain-containing protein [uncultured Chryseobacterium sp.]|uniref:DUF3667 domain-containing protein n=1 Tax=uncultured Chryseobacterium sp. TaxID=259322 RepID=UPI00258F060C|nr:DUF3667 domain-containing protein [uncultured Chryseobacterium sp.]
MSHGKIREDKTCLNCGHAVEERFCPHCGQENTEPKHPFHYLFTHFIEDFTHYDGQFWKTIKYLLIRPGRLTKEYLAGKRQMYVAPVKLYIFISFITFFLPTLFSGSEEELSENEKKEQILKEKEQDEKIARFTDSLKYSLQKDQLIKENLSSSKTEKDLKIGSKKNTTDPEEDTFTQTADGKMSILGATTMKQFDSLSLKNQDKKAVFAFLKPYAKKIFHFQEQGLKKDQIFEKFTENIVHTLPKALFVYLPIFAFFLWLFHNKKKWWYFDHGIFTLHYFSFLLLGILIIITISELTSLLPDNTIFNTLTFSLYSAAVIYMLVYFFIAHHRVYKNARSISVMKGILLFIVNLFGLFCMFLLLMYVSFMTMH